MTSAERREKIRRARLAQPLNELRRKANIACNRANIWSQEELDAANAEAAELAKFFDENRAGGDASHSSEI